MTKMIGDIVLNSQFLSIQSFQEDLADLIDGPPFAELYLMAVFAFRY